VLGFIIKEVGHGEGPATRGYGMLGRALTPHPVTQTDTLDRPKWSPPLAERSSFSLSAPTQTPIVKSSFTQNGYVVVYPAISSHGRHTPFLNHHSSPLFSHFTCPSPFSFDGFRHVFQLHSRLRFDVVVVERAFTHTFY